MIELVNVEINKDELKQLFDHLVEELLLYKKNWDSSDFLYVHLYGDFDIDTHLNNSKNCSSTRLGCKKLVGLKSGCLYLISFRITKYYIFVPSEYEMHSNFIIKRLREKFKIIGSVWFSYMKNGGHLRWHKDGVLWRYHFVICNVNNKARIEFKDSFGKISVYSPEESSQFLMKTNIKHRVKTSSERLHLIASVEKM